MKLNRGMLVATVAMAGVLGVGFVSVVGINRASDHDDPRVVAEEAAMETGATDGDATVATNGVEEYRGGASRGGGARGGASHGGGYGHTGWGHAGGYGRGGRGWEGRGWGGRGWGNNRWGRWGGGRYVGGRWIDGNYTGWCDARYYDCNRAWW